MQKLPQSELLDTFLFPRVLDYQRMKSGYNELVTERSKVMNLYHDLQRLQQMEGLLRKNLGADLELSGYEENLGGLFGKKMQKGMM
ncbi:MAG: hypothetical protein CM1200mP10_10630 [Candidatus Neomarinimicrobiota bacterium]|nr:MAG: hypothetical protein CM1200mP10_10630 [Candidatus Neomarinimicrobiota bacterium]